MPAYKYTSNGGASFFDTYEACKADYEASIASTDYFTTVPYSATGPFNLTSDQIGVYNFQTTYPVYVLVYDMQPTTLFAGIDEGAHTGDYPYPGSYGDYPDPGFPGDPVYVSPETRASGTGFLGDIFYYRKHFSGTDHFYYALQHTYTLGWIFGVPICDGYDTLINPEGPADGEHRLSGPIYNFVDGSGVDPAYEFVTMQSSIITMPSCTTAFELAIQQSGNRPWIPNPANLTNTPLKYKQPGGVSTVSVCFGASRKGLVRPAKDGGFMLYETESDGTTGKGFAYIFRLDRTLLTVVPVNQVFIYLP